MQLSYGDHTFDANSLWPFWSRRVVRNDAGFPLYETITLNIRGYLSAVGQSAITTAINDLRAALKIPYKDLAFKHDDASNSAHILRQTGSISGVVIIDGPHFTGQHGAEYATQREFEFTAEADYPLSNTTKKLVSFFESLTTMGGYPLYVCREALNGPPQRSLVYPRTTCTVIQSGKAVGFRDYPTPPPPLFPQALRGGRDGVRITPGTPERRGDNYINYPISWEYLFESPTPLVGTPTLWKD